MAGTAKERFDLFRSEIDNFPGKSKIPLARGGWASWPPGPQQKLGGLETFRQEWEEEHLGRCPNDPYSQSTFISSLQVEVGKPSSVVCLFAQGRGACVKDGSGWKALVAPRGEVQQRMLVGVLPGIASSCYRGPGCSHCCFCLSKKLRGCNLAGIGVHWLKDCN